MLLRICTGNFNIVLKDTGWVSSFFFPGENYFIRRFFRIWFEKHFSLVCPLGNYTTVKNEILSWFIRSWTIEKIDVSSTNNLAMELSLSGRSVIYIKNNRGPRMSPCGTPALIGSQLDSWSFNNTLWNLFEKTEQLSTDSKRFKFK